MKPTRDIPASSRHALPAAGGAAHSRASRCWRWLYTACAAPALFAVWGVPLFALNLEHFLDLDRTSPSFYDLSLSVVAFLLPPFSGFLLLSWLLLRRLGARAAPHAAHALPSSKVWMFYISAFAFSILAFPLALGSTDNDYFDLGLHLFAAFWLLPLPAWLVLRAAVPRVRQRALGRRASSAHHRWWHRDPVADLSALLFVLGLCSLALVSHIVPVFVAAPLFYLAYLCAILLWVDFNPHGAPRPRCWPLLPWRGMLVIAGFLLSTSIFIGIFTLMGWNPDEMALAEGVSAFSRSSSLTIVFPMAVLLLSSPAWLLTWLAATLLSRSFRSLRPLRHALLGWGLGALISCLASIGYFLITTPHFGFTLVLAGGVFSLVLSLALVPMTLDIARRAAARHRRLEQVDG